MFLATKIDIFCKFLLTTKTEEMEKKKSLYRQANLFLIFSS
ncbi:hypothetical protein PORCAN_1980 [Porphyromonas crevioricanis JCM 13913]|nr:hypothetical protein PORCAN_1980 [Porphyromonas crevioricanis JCM 13913]